VRVLFLSQLWPYPPDSGGKVKAYHALRGLAADHEVTLLAFARPEDSFRDCPEVTSLCRQVKVVVRARSPWRDLRELCLSMARGRAFTLERDRNAEMSAAVTGLCDGREFDVIHADRLHMAAFVPRPTRATTILDAHNVESQVFARLSRGWSNPVRRGLYRLEARRLAAAEGRIVAGFDHVLCVSQADRDNLVALAGPHFAGREPAFSVIPVGVDCHYFGARALLRHPHRLLLVGNLGWPPNAEAAVWCLQRVFPCLRRALPQVRLVIIGARAPLAVRRLARPPGVILRGYVPDLRPEYAQAAALLVPLRSGSGLRVKILEAFAAGLPVVSTTVGAEGIEAVSDRHLLLADDARAFAAAAIRVLTTPRLARRLSAESRSLAESHYDWPLLHDRLRGVYWEIAQNRDRHAQHGRFDLVEPARRGR
jgi:glycosyltransferase involved in cell wall biosynthesis